jgi:ABC-type transport system involved in multi-copper enzyme maturation permease subunit
VPKFAAIVYANLLFFSLALMLSEVFRGTTLAILATIGILVASLIIGSFLSVMSLITQEQIYMNITELLPNWSASNFPSFLLAKLITVPTSPFISVMSGNLLLAGAIIAGYISASIIVATIRLVESDVSKKTA